MCVDFFFRGVMMQWHFLFFPPVRLIIGKIPWRLKSTDEREQKRNRKLPGNQIMAAVWQEIKKRAKICVCAQPK